MGAISRMYVPPPLTKTQDRPQKKHLSIRSYQIILIIEIRLLPVPFLDQKQTVAFTGEQSLEYVPPPLTKTIGTPHN